MPKVSIGLPVYKGERFLSAAIESILAQTFEDFELIIVDNASTDRTEEISREFAARDSRIRYTRNKENIGGAANHNLAFDMARSGYFRWASDDDVLEPEYLAKTVEALDSRPETVLCHTKVRVIDEEGNPLRDYEIDMRNLQSPDPAERFADLLLVRHACYDIFGLMRSETLRKTPRLANYFQSDRNLLGELAMLGRFYTVPERLFLSRDHGGRSVRIPTHERAYIWFRHGKKGGIVFPYWRNMIEYYRAIRRAPLTPRQRAQCRRIMRTWLWRNWRLLAGDVKIALKRSVGLRN